MVSGRKTSFTIRLTLAQRQTLLADGVTITDIAATVGLSRRHPYRKILLPTDCHMLLSRQSVT